MLFRSAAAHDFLSIFILLAFLLVKEGKVRLSIFLNIRNVSVIIGALLAGPIGMQANLYAVKYIGSSLASSVSAIYPAVSVLLAFFILKHKVSKNTVFGVFLIIAAIIAQTYKVEQVNSFYIGILCALVCAIAWGSESVLREKLKTYYLPFIRCSYCSQPGLLLYSPTLRAGT